MALNPNAFVDGVMDEFSLHIEPPSYVSHLRKKLLLKCAGPQINHAEYMEHEILFSRSIERSQKKGKHGQPGQHCDCRKCSPEVLR